MMMAMDCNNLIGKADGMPWHISTDLKYFKRLTMGKPLIMGRVTFDSIGKPLPGRTSIVITRDASWSHPGAKVVGTLQEGFEVASTEAPEEVMVIGGASICQLAMPVTERL